MAGLPDAKIDIVRTLVASAPDKVVSGLRNALAAADGDTALAGVRRVVEAEVAERKLRNKALQPIAPLFVDRGGDPGRLAFPPRALPMLWRGLREVAAEDVATAALVMADFEQGVTSTEAFDRLTERLVEEVEARTQRDIVGALDFIEADRQGGEAVLRTCLAISPVVRRATEKLPEWIGRTTQERAAAARLAYRDACRVGDDAGPRFFEMLGAQLAEPWTILRIVSAVMDHPTESYLSGSELSPFATRLMDGVDANLKIVAGFDLNGGAPAGEAAAAAVEVLTLQITELEDAIDLAREGGWGGRIQKQKQALASVVEKRLRELPRLQATALPTQKVRIARALVTEPSLSLPPDQGHVTRCRSLLTFAEGIRASANYGGFASTRTKVMEAAGEALDQYVEDVLARVREGEAPDREIAALMLQVAAEFAGLIHEPRACEIVRRRAASAFGAVTAPRPAWEDPARQL
ncbi:MAG: hypothetical protein C0481_19080 [Phenylobacterium sp.]|uniref:hypothetical protein n=1 Tax=Phenylobacterium sp. TaxID=1871053 RepID=UPI0025E1CA0E|nr:hypothetical protein [Phenylobacterium sp.]MBA4013971.1 hypothetical protein [Phenylobacterium sp.]